LDYEYELRRYELDDQLRSGLDWDDYEPETYGWWEKSRTRLLRKTPTLEIADEFGITSVPHKTRHYRRT
jgi:hypothetical protein